MAYQQSAVYHPQRGSPKSNLKAIAARYARKIIASSQSAAPRDDKKHRALAFKILLFASMFMLFKITGNYRNGSNNAGANMSESNISRKPPSPAGMKVAESFTPHSRFILLSTKSPNVPRIAAATPNAIAFVVA